MAPQVALMKIYHDGDEMRVTLLQYSASFMFPFEFFIDHSKKWKHPAQVFLLFIFSK